MKIILNKTNNSLERYTLIDGSMGNCGDPKNHANHYYEICNGVDRGNGYQGYQSVSYFLKDNKHAPIEAKQKVKEILKRKNLVY